VREVDDLTHLHVPNVMKLWGPKPPGTLWATLGLLRDDFTLLLLLLLTAIELSLGGSRPYTSTDKTNKNKYT